MAVRGLRSRFVPPRRHPIHHAEREEFASIPELVRCPWCSRNCLRGQGAIPCVVYAAKSTEDRRGSIPDQLHDCREALAGAGERLLVAEYSDEACSAFLEDRGPGLLDAMQHAEELASDHGAAELW